MWVWEGEGLGRCGRGRVREVYEGVGLGKCGECAGCRVSRY